MFATAHKVYFLNDLWQPIKCFENSNSVTKNSCLFEIVNHLYLNAVTINCPYGLNLSLQQLLRGNPAKHVQTIILFIHLERRKKGTYTVLYVRLGGQCWYHYTLAFPVPGPASLAMQIGTCKTKVNKELHKAGRREGEVSQLWL